MLLLLLKVLLNKNSAVGNNLCNFLSSFFAKLLILRNEWSCLKISFDVSSIKGIFFIYSILPMCLELRLLKKPFRF